MARTSRGAAALFTLGPLFAVYVGLCVVARLGYRVLLYPAPDDPPPAPRDSARMLTLRAADGVAVHAMQFPAPSADARVVVVFHGNGETIANGVGLAEDLRRRGFGVVLQEYRGYGVSRRAARPSEDGIYLDAVAVLDELGAQGIGPGRVVLMGTSLGTGVAAEMARRGRGGSLVLVSPYTSITAMARRLAPFLPASWICPDAFDTLSKADEIKVPTLVVHGDQDEVIPFRMGRIVAEAIPGATLHVVEGGHHNDLFARWGARLIEEIAKNAER